MDEWALLTRFKDLKEKEAALKEKQDLKSKQQSFKEILDQQKDLYQRKDNQRRLYDKLIDRKVIEYD